MDTIKILNIDGVDYEIKDAEARESIEQLTEEINTKANASQLNNKADISMTGNLSQLKTNEKSNLVAAINETAVKNNCVYTNNGWYEGNHSISLSTLNIKMDGLYLIYLEHDKDTLVCFYHPNNATGFTIGASGNGISVFKDLKFNYDKFGFTATDLDGDAFAISVIQLASYIDNY